MTSRLVSVTIGVLFAAFGVVCEARPDDQVGVAPKLPNPPTDARGSRVAVKDQAPQATPPPTLAERPNGGFHGWQIEAHGGFIPASTADGTGGLPLPGQSFDTFQAIPSRKVPSWYFGDGALLANQVTTSAGIDSRITPLDPVVTRSSVERQNAASFGFRVGHSITSLFFAELNVDVGGGHLHFSRDAQNKIEATRASFASYFETVLRRNPNAANASATSTASIVHDEGAQTMVTGDVNVRLPSAVGLIPYVTIGGGFMRPYGINPNVTLTGSYEFTQSMPGSVLDGAPIHEVDRVLVRYVPRSTALALIGGGVQRAISAHTGIRLDTRVYFRSMHSRISIDANPLNVPGNPRGRIVRGMSPQIQISSQEGFPTSLSGVAQQFVTFDGTGHQVSVTAGYFFRF